MPIGRYGAAGVLARGTGETPVPPLANARIRHRGTTESMRIPLLDFLRVSVTQW